MVRGYGIVASEEVGTTTITDRDSGYNNGYHYYHQNEHGDIEYITGKDGKVENAYTYDSFGNIINSTELVKNRYTYNGEQYDQVTQQYYLRARYYNPLVGRFTQEDVYRGDGLNLYAYCGNNPVVYVDPSGYAKQSKCAPGQSKDVGEGNNNVNVDSYKNMMCDNNVSGQAHHLSQDAAFKKIIPRKKGLCVELHGNAFSEIGSQHYNAHNSLEKFWNQYRRNGTYDGSKPTIGEYNRALYNSLKCAGFSDIDASYAVIRAYEQQQAYGFGNSSFVPRVPGRINQKKR